MKLAISGRTAATIAQPPTEEALGQAQALSWALRDGENRRPSRTWQAIVETSQPTVRP
jgi:hypothetical protein